MRLPIGAIVIMLLLAGCAGVFGGETPEKQTPIRLAENPPDPDQDVIG